MPDIAYERPLHNTSSPEFVKQIIGRSHEITLEFLKEIQVMTSFFALCRGLYDVLIIFNDFNSNHPVKAVNITK